MSFNQKSETKKNKKSDFVVFRKTGKNERYGQLKICEESVVKRNVCSQNYAEKLDGRIRISNSEKPKKYFANRIEETNKIFTRINSKTKCLTY